MNLTPQHSYIIPQNCTPLKQFLVVLVRKDLSTVHVSTSYEEKAMRAHSEQRDSSDAAVYAAIPFPTPSGYQEGDLLTALQRDGLMNEFGATDAANVEAETVPNLEEELAKLGVLQLKACKYIVLSFIKYFT